MASSFADEVLTMVKDEMELRFQERAPVSFGFLVEDHGFACVIASDRRVRYESTRVFVEISLGFRDREVSISFGRLNTDEYFSFWFFLKLVDPPLAKSFGTGIAETPDAVASILERLATAIKSQGREIISGEDAVFERMKDVRWWDFCPEVLGSRPDDRGGRLGDPTP